MIKPTAAQISALEHALINEGRIIEAGWMGLRAMAIPASAPPIQIEEMRNAFFAGAQHLFKCIIGTVDVGEGVTEADLARIDKIELELRDFINDYSVRRLPTEGHG